MASRRKLKKIIQFVSSELITGIYFRCIRSKSIDTEKVETIVKEIVETANEFKLRAGRPTGKDNPKLVKAYYNSLFDAWQIKMDGIVQSIESL